MYGRSHAMFLGGLPTEGLLGAARLALRVALRAIAAAARRRRTLLFVCRGFEFVDSWPNEPAHGSLNF
jgi:hypothetical protein